MTYGLLGGTFNPPHVAHLLCARAAYEQLGLDRVALVPVNAAPHKDSADDPGAEHRLAMCRAAAAGEEGWLEVCDVETRRPGPSYTVDTLRELHEIRPGEELTLIVGGDMAWTLPTWREPAEMLRLAKLAVAERAGVRREDLREHLAALVDDVCFIDLPRMDVSSSDLRRRVREGRSIRWLAPDAVADYIRTWRLYA